MDTQQAVNVQDELPDAGDAWKALRQCFIDANADRTDAYSVDTLLLPEEGYQMAVDGQEKDFPGVRMKVDNSRVLWLSYDYDAGMLASIAQ